MPFPAGVEVYTWDGCTSCDVPPSALVKVALVDGQVERTRVWESTAPRFIHGAWVEDGIVYLAECAEGNCGFTLGAGPATGWAELFASDDGGASWAFVRTIDVDEESGRLSYTPQAPDSVLPYERVDDGTYTLPSGTRLSLSDLDAAAHYLVRQVATRGALEVLSWTAVISEERGTAYRYITGVRDGVGEWTYYSPGFDPASFIRDDLLIGVAYFGRPPFAFDIRTLGGMTVVDGAPLYEAWLPSILDIRTGQVHPILEHFSERPGNRNSVVGVRFLD